MRTAGIIIAGCLLVACTPTWVQPGRTATDWERDMYACERDSAAASDQRAYSMKIRCMKTKGWTPT